MAQIDALLRELKERGGSDLHFASGQPPRIRLHGELAPIAGQAVLTNEGLRDLLREIAKPDAWEEYEQTHDLDFAYALEGTARFRANYFVQERGAGAVFRIIPETIVSLEDLNLPEAIERLVHYRKGLILVTGPRAPESRRPSRPSSTRSTGPTRATS